MAHLKLGDYYMDIAGDDQRALVRLDTAYRLRNRVTDRERHFIAAQYFSAHQQFDEARESLQALTALYPDDPDFHYELAISLYALEQIPAAVNELRQSIRFNPHGARAHGTLVLLLARANRADAALDALAEARRAGVVAPYLLWASGLARLGKADVAGARSDFGTLGKGVGYFSHLGQLQETFFYVPKGTKQVQYFWSGGPHKVLGPDRKVIHDVKVSDEVVTVAVPMQTVARP